MRTTKDVRRGSGLGERFGIGAVWRVMGRGRRDVAHD